MPATGHLFDMLADIEARVAHRAPPCATPPAPAVGAVADDAEHVRPERRIDAMDTNRPDDDAVPEHDPDGTPWAA